MSYPILNINNQLRAEVVNRDEINFDFSAKDFSPNGTIVQDFSPEFKCTNLPNDGYTFIINWIAKLGVTQNIPCTIIDSENPSIIYATGILDLAAEGAEYILHERQLKVPFVNSRSNFFEIAESLKIRDFYDKSLFVKTTYVRNNIPDYMQAALLGITIFIATKEAIQAGKDLVKSIVAAIPRSATDLGAIVAAALVVLANAIYFAAVIFALFTLLKQLSDAIFGKPKTYFAIDVPDVIRKGCQALGYELESSIIDGLDKLTFLARTSKEGVLKGEPVNDPRPDDSLLQFIERFAALTNAKVKPTKDNKVLVEQRTTFEDTPSNVQLNDVWDRGRSSVHLNKYQAISIRFQNNFVEDNIQDNKYTVMFLTENGSGNAPNSLPEILGIQNQQISKDPQKIYTTLKDKLEIQLSFAKGGKKGSQTFLEKTFNSIFDLVTGLNKSAKLDIGERKDLLLLGADRVPTDTIYYRGSGDNDRKLDGRTEALLASNVYKAYDIESPFNSQFETVKGIAEQPLCNALVASQLTDNNVAKDPNGRDIIITQNKQNQDGLYSFEYQKRLQKGDLFYSEEDNWEVIVVENDSPENKNFTIKEFKQFLSI